MSSPRFGAGGVSTCDPRPMIVTSSPGGGLQASPPGGLTPVGVCPLGHPLLSDPCTGQVVCACHSMPPSGGLQQPPQSALGLGPGFYPRLESLCGAAGAGNKAELLRSSLPAPFPANCPIDPYTAYPYLSSYAGIDARRKNSMKEATNTLKAWLYEHRKNPYPTKGEKIMLAIITKMTLTQVSTWFANARRRLKKENKMTWGVDKEEEGEEGEDEGREREEMEALDDKENYEDDIEDDDDSLDVEVLSTTPTLTQSALTQSALTQSALTQGALTQGHLSQGMLGHPSPANDVMRRFPHHLSSRLTPSPPSPHHDVIPSTSNTCHLPSAASSPSHSRSAPSPRHLASGGSSPEISHQSRCDTTSRDTHAVHHGQHGLEHRAPPAGIIVQSEQRSPEHGQGHTPAKTSSTAPPVQKPRIWSIADVVKSDTSSSSSSDLTSEHSPTSTAHVPAVVSASASLPRSLVNPGGSRMYGAEESRYSAHAQLVSTGLGSGAPYHMYPGYMAGMGGAPVGLQSPYPTLLPSGYWKAS